MTREQAAHLAAIAQAGAVISFVPPALAIGAHSRDLADRPGVTRRMGTFTRAHLARWHQLTRHAAAVLYARRRELHRIAWHGAKMLWTVRKAFPWPLRVLCVVGTVQIPFLITDEIAAGAALVWIIAKYRPLGKVIWRAAILEVTKTDA